jgi:hypothetical protein
LHNIKSKNFKKINKKNFEKGLKEFALLLILLVSGVSMIEVPIKIEWRMKVGIEWRPSIAGRLKIGGQSTNFSLLSSFPLHYLPL